MKPTLKLLLSISILLLFFSCKKENDNNPPSASSGIEWISHADSPSFSMAVAQDIETDASGNIFIVGYADKPVIFGTITMNDFTYGSSFLAKMNPQGQFVWVKDIARSYTPKILLELDSRGNPVICFHYSDLPVNNNLQDILPSTDNNIGLAKFSSDGLHMWSVGGGSTNNGDYPFCMAIDPNDNVFLAGSFFQYTTFQDKTLTEKFAVKGTFIAKFDGGGKCGWIRESNEYNYEHKADYNEAAVYAMACDSKGNCYVSGRYTSQMNFLGYNIETDNMSGFIGRININGNCDWITPQHIVFPTFKSLIVDKDDNLVCGGASAENVQLTGASALFTSNNKLLFSKLSASQNWLWAKEIVETDRAIPEMGSSCNDMDCDLDGNIYFTGNSNGTTRIGINSFNTSSTLEEMIYVAKLSSDGNVLWVRSNNLSDAASASESIAVDGNNNCFIAGYRNRAFSMDDKQLQDGRGVFVAKIKQ
ncbi:MAG: hypothetical protein HXX13_10870 [Bacteroidetes bacterium]|nr:hypothetical protein [Bacteroidota bacterium]